jgi:hypothetical protein
MFKLFNKKKDNKNIETPIALSYLDFWEWFMLHEKDFFDTVKYPKTNKIESHFFNKIDPELKKIRDGFFFLSGMFEDSIAELIITADAKPKNIVFCEELIAAAPKLDNWRFTALKPAVTALSSGDNSIKMNDYDFGLETLTFEPIVDETKPDEIGISIYHQEFQEDKKDLFVSGIYIFLDNFLGELRSLEILDFIDIAAAPFAEDKKVAMSKLPDYLTWRQKEFVEKHEGTRRDTENDSYQTSEMVLENGNPILAIVNVDLINWDLKASHPWMLNIGVNYNGDSNNGLPDELLFQKLAQLEDEIMMELKDEDGYLNLARETGDNLKEIYFACKDYRKPSKVLSKIQAAYPELDMDYKIYKDKYWASLNHFNAF